MELQRRLGHTDTVIELAQQRLRANPRHIPSLAALTWAYGQTGQTALQCSTRPANSSLAGPKRSAASTGPRTLRGSTGVARDGVMTCDCC